MNGFTPGFWDVADRGLQWIGRSAARLLSKRRSTEDECAKHAAIGGALLCAAYGGIVGFTLSYPSQRAGAIVGTILGGSLGVCLGIVFGSFVGIVDSTIKDLLRSLNSK